MRISAEHLDRRKIKHPERIYVVSKSNGWLTVDSQALSRKNAYEHMPTQLVNRETSPLSPSWMQGVNALRRDEASATELKKQSVFGKCTRVEENRIILFDTKQPLLTGDHQQTTNSIFEKNDLVAGKKLHQEVCKKCLEDTQDTATLYDSPADRFGYRSHLIEDAARAVGDENRAVLEAKLAE